MAKRSAGRATRPTTPLDAREKRFVEEYLVHLDTKMAAIAAGYSASVAASKAYQWVSNGKVKPRVYAAVQEAMANRSQRTGVTAERVIEELAKIGFANMQDYMRANADGDPYLDFSNLTRDQAAALAEVTVEDFKDGRGEDARDVRRVKFKLHDKRAALVDLGKHLGLFKERVEHTGKDGGPIEVEEVSAHELVTSRIARLTARSGQGEGS
jgi:phage terminase small subunit